MAPSIWFTSDLHLRHQLVADVRGFASTHEHDEAICSAWWNVVDNEDIVYVLGDLTVRAHEYALNRIATLPGRKRLILGNHDEAHPMFKGYERAEAPYRDVFESVGTHGMRTVNGVDAMLSHFPYDGDSRSDDRGVRHRLRDVGVPVIHGHTHSKEQLTRSHAGTLQVHVGLDAHGYQLVPESWVAKALAGA
ncbi:metallophosphoesterase family protein [Demequina rhizosphaerae]|uniref:metallophosphoesterase family protein n=1 Tax=Demequina rhizosphaerae TaxID=1638985 RepID=UPI000781B2DD|nr:metallophosphoesterase family protein [Demequina rhizosphaerae]